MRLAGAYEAAIRELGRTLAVLNARIAELPGDKDERLRQLGENAETRLEQARRALERHLAEHGC
jgi:hypothetical protein